MTDVIRRCKSDDAETDHGNQKPVKQKPRPANLGWGFLFVQPKDYYLPFLTFFISFTFLAGLINFFAIES
jgi:hypothetical protein